MKLNGEFINGWYAFWCDYGKGLRSGVVTRDRKAVLDYVSDWMTAQYMAHGATCDDD